jgi:hypothetical protein
MYLLFPYFYSNQKNREAGSDYTRTGAGKMIKLPSLIRDRYKGENV